MEHQALVRYGLALLRDVLAPYICDKLEKQFGTDWWKNAVINTIPGGGKRGLPSAERPKDELIDSLDITSCCLLFIHHWKEVFKNDLSPDCLGRVHLVKHSRNRWAKTNTELGYFTFTHEDACQTMNAMVQFCEQIDPRQAEEIRKICHHAGVE